MPSPTSASTASMSEGYGSIPAAEYSSSFDSEDAASEMVVLVKGSDDENDKSGRSRILPVIGTRARRVLIGAFLGLLVVVWMGHRNNSGSGSSDENPSKAGGMRFRHDGVDDDDGSKGQTTTFLSPVKDMGMLSLLRNDDASPSAVWGNHLEQQHPLPTNSWYLNLVSNKAASQPDDQTRVYTVPYIIDTVAPWDGMAGLRVHWPVLQASETNIQMVSDYKNSLCLGAEGSFDDGYRVRDGPLSHLGVGLEWGSSSTGVMATNVIRGMPYATMEYTTGEASTSSKTPVPTIYSYYGLSSDVQIDRSSPFAVETSKSPKLVCGTKKTKGNSVLVQNHLHLHFINSDFTWMVFFSQPVKVSCSIPNGETDPKLRDFKLTIAEAEATSQSKLVVRVALLNQCTTGQASIQQHCLERNALEDPEGYERLLKAHAHATPNSPTIDFEYASTETAEDGPDVASLTIDWDATSTKNSSTDDLLMFALPHHQDSMSNNSTSTQAITDQCVSSFHGKTCLVQNSKWILEEPLGSPLSFLAPRPPRADFIPSLAESLKQDIRYKLSDNTMRGASDTYFSGKLLARVARVIVIANELRALASASSAEELAGEYFGDADVDTAMLEESIEAASKVSLPSPREIRRALDQLQKAVTVWLKSNAEAPYIYDRSWGGLVNCGCNYSTSDQFGHCQNSFPDCPALLDVNEDFGNGYYNDHHYHYGYHVYAAAVVAKFDPSWGRQHFDEVMLYVRDFANPYDNDAYFPQFRQKDWFLGSSWASGIVSAENSPHGRNEESSSEAISAYEGVTLFGSAMVDAFAENDDASDDDDEDSEAVRNHKLETARLVRDSGQLLTASELHATNRYWHVWSSETHTNHYPKAYQRPVVGMLYDTMATFQTWFAPWALVSYGIQLIPLTPVAETRDDPAWARELYPLYDAACTEAGDFCEKNGWSILQAGLLATAGNRTGALAQAQAVPDKVFATEGGIGNSMSNTLWYIATRKTPPVG